MTEVPPACTAESAVDRSAEMHDAIDDRPGPDAYAEQDPETRVVLALLSLIAGGFSEGRILLAATAAEQSGVTDRYALSVLDKYTGPRSDDHYWAIRRAGRGQSLYSLLSPAS